MKNGHGLSSNGDASSSQTKSAYNAVTSKGETSDFSYKVWNDLVNKVNEVQKEKGKSWSNEYATYSNTLMSSSSTTLTANRFNSLRYNIGKYHSTGISEVNTGDIVYGSYFITLTNKLNEWINE